MSIFQEFAITWNDKEYIVPPEKVMGLVEVVEDIITIEELNNKGGIKRAKVSRAFATALQYSGCSSVTQEDVYNKFFSAESKIEMGMIISSILVLMIPPEHLQQKTQPKKKPVQRKKAVRKS